MSRESRTPAVWDANRLRIATDAAGVALWSWHVDTDEIALDERAHRLWGVPTTKGTVTFEDLSSHIHPQDLDRVRAAFTATREILGPYEIDFRSSTAVTFAGYPLADAGKIRASSAGSCLGSSWTSPSASSPRKRAEDARRRNEPSRKEFVCRCRGPFRDRVALSGNTEGDGQGSSLRLAAPGQAHELVRPTLNAPQKATPLASLLAILLGLTTIEAQSAIAFA